MLEARLEALVRGTPRLMAMLGAVEAIGLPDAWIGAGVIRSTVWDDLHGRPVDDRWDDVDVLYFDAADTTKAPEDAAEAKLRAIMPDVPWEVRNQARMHLKSGLPPYRDTTDALRNFGETPTAVAVRRRGPHIDIIAPHGFADLFHCIVRPVFEDPLRRAIFVRRMESKNWPARWPKVRVLGLKEHPMDKVEKTDAEWREELSPEQYHVLRQHGTERAWTGKYVDNHDEGFYACAGCGQPLFSSDKKFESGSGWPSFTKPLADDAVATVTDQSHGMVRTEVLCSKCNGHLGHVFPDGPRDDGGLRFCMNSAALDFAPKGNGGG